MIWIKTLQRNSRVLSAFLGKTQYLRMRKWSPKTILNPSKFKKASTRKYPTALPIFIGQTQVQKT